MLIDTMQWHHADYCSDAKSETFQSRFNEAKSALLTAIAALEADRDWYAQQTNELFKQTPEYASAIAEMQKALHKHGFVEHPDPGDTAALDGLLEKYGERYYEARRWGNARGLSEAISAIHDHLAALVQAEREKYARLAESFVRTLGTEEERAVAETIALEIRATEAFNA